MRTGVSSVSANAALTVPVLNDTRILTNVTVSPPQSDIDLVMLYPDFLRKRAIPDHHMVEPREIYHHGHLVESENERIGIDASHGDLSAFLNMKSEQRGDQEETWNKLTELSVFALPRFGFFETKLGTGAYSSGKKGCTIRQ